MRIHVIGARQRRSVECRDRHTVSAGRLQPLLGVSPSDNNNNFLVELSGHLSRTSDLVRLGHVVGHVSNGHVQGSGVPLGRRRARARR